MADESEIRADMQSPGPNVGTQPRASADDNEVEWPGCVPVREDGHRIQQGPKPLTPPIGGDENAYKGVFGDVEFPAHRCSILFPEAGVVPRMVYTVMDHVDASADVWVVVQKISLHHVRISDDAAWAGRPEETVVNVDTQSFADTERELGAFEQPVRKRAVCLDPLFDVCSLHSSGGANNLRSPALQVAKSNVRIITLKGSFGYNGQRQVAECFGKPGHC